jgi:hypothetical protein
MIYLRRRPFYCYERQKTVGQSVVTGLSASAREHGIMWLSLRHSGCREQHCFIRSKELLITSQRNSNLETCSTQRVQVMSGLCPLNMQDVNYFQNFALFIQKSLPLNQYIAGIDLKVFENSRCTPFVESHVFSSCLFALFPFPELEFLYEN